jgi:FlaA1/EpsC-like NDP-sugar epimerase
VKREALERGFWLALIYGVVLWASGIASLLLRFDFDVPPRYQSYLFLWVAVAGMKLFLLGRFGQLAGLPSYFSIPDFRRILSAMTVAVVVLLVLRFAVPRELFAPPRSVIVVDYVLSTGAITLVRLGLRLLWERWSDDDHGTARPVAIVGAGDAGAQLVLELTGKRGLGLRPIAFFDDDTRKMGGRIHGISVVGPPEALADQCRRLEFQTAIIAMPSATAKRIGEVVRLCHKAGLRCETVPSLAQLATGRVRVSQLREVDIEDLLGRDAVRLDTENIRALLTGRVIMITGAGGSIGSELCRQIAAFAPQRLLLLEQAEGPLFLIEQELIELGHGSMIAPLVADILDEPRLRQILNHFRPAVIFHAAAHKHVPMMEKQPAEAVKNNSIATARLAELALEHEVERFVLISTDKAINPTSVMGATKRLAEIFLQALHAATQGPTRFMAVRFGNVLGSSGSVVPIFKRQIAAGGPVTVTHPEVSRYFMTIPEAVGLVLQSAALGSGGEIYVLDMGQPVRIVELARQLIELSGLRPDVDIEIKFTGLRPGEKIFEEISYHQEHLTETAHPKIRRFVSEPPPIKEARKLLARLAETAGDSTVSPAELKQLLKEGVPEYQPYAG